MLINSPYTYLTFAFDVSLNEEQDTFIPAGTQVKVYNGLHRQDSTKIIYQNQLQEYLNHSFLEYR
jgi:hypothetical protein